MCFTAVVGIFAVCAPIGILPSGSSEQADMFHEAIMSYNVEHKANP